MKYLKALQLLILAIAPAIRSFFDYAKEASDPRNRATMATVKQSIKQEKYEDKALIYADRTADYVVNMLRDKKLDKVDSRNLLSLMSHYKQYRSKC
jgi:hypothetical protein